MVRFSVQERVQMHLIYGEARGNSRLARRLYAERFPARILPYHSMFARVHRQLMETGSVVVKKPNSGRSYLLTPEQEEIILNLIEENPEISIRRASSQLEIPRTRIHRFIKRQLLKPFHFQKAQELKVEDLPRRRHFSLWALQRYNLNPGFIRNFFFTDEACFTKDGLINLHNLHYWAIMANPFVLRQTHSQEKFSINCWAGIVGDCIIGPYLLPPRLNAESYLNFLEHELPPLMEDVPLGIRRNLFFMHDGAPPHRGHFVTEWLNENFQGRWIGNNSPHVTWPPRSPDLNAMDFFFWGAMKDRVYAVPIRTREQLHERILAAAEEIRQIPNIHTKIRQNFVSRLQACVENGSHFEHVLRN